MLPSITDAAATTAAQAALDVTFVSRDSPLKREGGNEPVLTPKMPPRASSCLTLRFTRLSTDLLFFSRTARWLFHAECQSKVCCKGKPSQTKENKQLFGLGAVLLTDVRVLFARWASARWGRESEDGEEWLCDPARRLNRQDTWTIKRPVEKVRVKLQCLTRKDTKESSNDDIHNNTLNFINDNENSGYFFFTWKGQKGLFMNRLIITEDLPLWTSLH